MANEKATVISTYRSTDYLYKLLRVQGYVFPQRYRIAYAIYAFLVTGYVTLYMPLSFSIAVFKEVDDLGVFFTILQVTFDIYGGSLKIIFIGLMLQKLFRTQSIIHKLDERCTAADEIAEQKHLVHHGRKIVLITFSLYLTYPISTCMGAVSNGRPPYAIYFPYIDWRNSRWELYVATVLEIIMMSLACLQQAINDSYATVFIYILLSHMRILILRIKKLGKKPHLSKSQNVQELIMCIKDHKNLLELHRKIRSVVSVTVFIQFCLTATVLGTTFINIMRFSTTFSTRLGSCFFLVAIFIQNFPVCYYAQCLQDESSKLDQEIFHSQWIEQNLEYRKTLIFFLHRSQYIMKLDAAKLIPINLNSFLSIAKFSFSLYTLIQKMV